MRRPIVIGNWKMHGTRASIAALLESLTASSFANMDMVVLPPYIYLPQVAQTLLASQIAWGAQNICAEANGAFTGEISAVMLQQFDCRYVLVGHSERRTLYQEDDQLVAKKFIQAQQAGLTPILCVGETLQQREQGATFRVIEQQLQAVLTQATDITAWQNAIIAYEPVWAIGTGKTASSEQAQEVHAMIRQFIATTNQRIANSMRIIYGGSVKADNAAQLFAMPDIDGGLIGGASLDAEQFIAICQAAENSL